MDTAVNLHALYENSIHLAILTRLYDKSIKFLESSSDEIEQHLDSVFALALGKLTKNIFPFSKAEEAFNILKGIIIKPC